VNTTITEIPTSKLKPAKDNIRSELGDVTELATSIQSHGLQVPLIVVPNGDGQTFEVVAGGRRLAAARKLKLATVECDVRGPMTDVDRVATMIAENVQRRSLTPTDEARAYQRLVDLGWSQRKVGEEFGITQPQVSKRLSLLELPTEAQKEVDAGGITIPEALELTKIRDPKRVKRVLQDHSKSKRQDGWTPSIDGAVRRELEEERSEAKREKVTADLEAKGVKILGDEVKGGWWSATSKIQVLRGYGNLAHVDIAKHRKEPCRAVVVDRWGEVTELCTEPSRHPAPSGSHQARQSTADRKRKEEESQQRAAADKRAAVVTNLLAARLDRGELLPLVVRELLSASHQSVLKIAAKLLGLEPIRRHNEWGGSLNYSGPMLEEAGSDERKLLRLAFAIAAAAAEESLRSPWGGAWTRRTSYLDFLEAHGYELSEIERTKLDEGRKEDAEEEAAEVQACRECGCTDEEACEGGCSWVEADLCSACVEREPA
jgi:ParB/RepB/Spo0J family partition protein